MNWKKLEAIFFDLDDTLYPEGDYVKSGFKSVATYLNFNYGISNIKSELFSMFDRGLRGNIFDILLDKYSDLNISVDELVNVYRNHEPQIKPFDGVENLLKILKKDKVLVLISDGYLAVQERKLESLKLAEYFNEIIFSDQWGRNFWKPSIRPFQEALRRIEIAPNNSVYIADNPIKDFKGAKELNIYTIRLRMSNCEYTKEEPISWEYAPDFTVNSISELKILLNYD